MSDNKNEQHHHVYDGIIEHNNPMPMWWIWTFILCIIFAFIYYIHYELAGGPTLQDELKESMAQIEQLKKDAGVNSTEISEADILKNLNEPESVKAGAAIFAARCAVCHGENLEGKIGPNLTDKSWINGDGKSKTIAHLIQTGIPAKGMPPWTGILSDDEIKKATAFVLSKKNTNPANAKAAEGNIIEGYFN
jgi:cytochrome c oxidase cbb3-type subunit III